MSSFRVGLSQAGLLGLTREVRVGRSTRYLYYTRFAEEDKQEYLIIGWGEKSAAVDWRETLAVTCIYIYIYITDYLMALVFGKWNLQRMLWLVYQYSHVFNVINIAGVWWTMHLDLHRFLFCLVSVWNYLLRSACKTIWFCLELFKICVQAYLVLFSLCLELFKICVQAIWFCWVSVWNYGIYIMWGGNMGNRKSALGGTGLFIFLSRWYCWTPKLCKIKCWLCLIVS